MEKMIDDNYDQKTKPMMEFSNVVRQQFNMKPSVSNQAQAKGQDFLKNRTKKKTVRKQKKNGKVMVVKNPEDEKSLDDFDIMTELSHTGSRRTKKWSQKQKNANKFTKERGSILKAEENRIEKGVNPTDVSRTVQYDDSKKSFRNKKSEERLIKSKKLANQVMNQQFMRERDENN